MKSQPTKFVKSVPEQSETNTIGTIFQESKKAFRFNTISGFEKITKLISKQ